MSDGEALWGYLFRTYFKVITEGQEVSNLPKAHIAS